MKPVSLIACLVIPAAAPGTVLELFPVQDAYVCDCQPGTTNPNGNSSYLYHGQFGSCFDRTLIQWDISDLPENIEIISAEMNLYCEAFWGTPSGGPVYFMIDGDWDENTVTFNSQPGYDTTVSVSADWPAAGTWHSVDVQPFVEEWISGTHCNYGIYCFCQGTEGTSVPGFWSGDYPDEELRPRLVIEYQEMSFASATWGLLKSILR